MMTSRQATTDDLPVVRDLLWEYLQWANEHANREFQVNFDIASMLQTDMDTIQKFLPPQGRLLLADDGSSVVGCACMHTIGPAIAELKRMYVRPNNRRQGIGHRLVQDMIETLHANGYRSLRLDSARFMKDAHRLYHAMGFHEIEQDPESGIPEDIRKNWIYMERTL